MSDFVCDLDILDNASITELNGITSNNVSPTDLWSSTILYDKYNIKFKGFYKVFVSPYSLPLYSEYKKSNISLGKLKSLYCKLYGLIYEIYVYKFIIKPLIEYNICPNFVRYLGSCLNCNFDTMYLFLENINKKNFERNMLHTLNMSHKRPSLTNKLDIKSSDKKNWYIKSLHPETKFNILLNKSISDNTTRLSDYLKSLSYTDLSPCPYYWTVIFQIAYTCYTMYLSRMIHYDLHYNNIWIEKIPKTLVTYVVNDKSFSFYTIYKILIYDFDRSYVLSFGLNTNTDPTSKNEKYSDKFINNLDILRCFSYLYMCADPLCGKKTPFYPAYSPDKLPTNFQTVLLNILTDNKDNQNELHKLFLMSQHLTGFKYKSFKKINHIYDILLNITKYLQLETKESIKNKYSISKDYFNNDGILKIIDPQQILSFNTTQKNIITFINTFNKK